MKKKIGIIVALVALMFGSRTATAQVFPLITITPNPLEFPDTSVGTTSDEYMLTATASGGTLPTYIFAAKIGDDTNFAIASDLCSGVALADGDSCSVTLTFSPQAMGHYSTSFQLISLSQTIISSSLIEGKGVEPRVALSTTSIDFGDQTVGKSSGEHQVVMINPGNTALSITSIAASTDFSVTDDCGASLAAEGSCTLGVTFTPPSANAFTGTVTITDDASDSPQTITLSGTGVVPGTPDADLSRHEIDFPSQLAGTTSSAQATTLANTGTVDLTITSIVASGNFAVTDDCGDTLAADERCTLNSTFSPNAAGSFSGTITVNDNASDSPQTIALTGTGVENSGPDANLSASTLDFGDQTVNTESAAQSVTITNAGDENLTISDVQTGGTDPQNFDASDNCHENALTPGETCQISVTFEPDDKGTYTATITITDNSTSSPHIITLSGVGIDSGGSGGGCTLLAAPQVSGFMPAALLLLALAAARRRK